MLFAFVVKQHAEHEIEENSFIIVTKSQIHVFDGHRIEIARISGLNVVSASLIDSAYLYLMNEFSDKVRIRYIEPEEDSDEEEAESNSERFVQESGFTAININAFFERKFGETWVSHAATGHNHFINRSWTTQDISIMRSLEEVAIMPIPHHNQISFIGMGAKNDYLIWKDSVDGFFTALHSSGKLITWSSVTGKLLWEELQTGAVCKENLKGYRVYRSDKDD